MNADIAKFDWHARTVKLVANALRAEMPEAATFLDEAHAGIVKAWESAQEALSEAEDYFDNRSDVSDGDYGIPEANEEMRLLSIVQSATV